MSGPNGHFAYVSDDGNTYRIKLNGHAAAAAGLAPLAVGNSKPEGMHPRYVLAQGPNGKERQLVVNRDSALYINGGTVTLTDFDATPSTEVTYNIRGRIGERRLTV